MTQSSHMRNWHVRIWFIYEHSYTNIDNVHMWACRKMIIYEHSYTNIGNVHMWACRKMIIYLHSYTHIGNVHMWAYWNCLYMSANMWVFLRGNNLFVYECSHMSSHTNIEDVNMWAIIYRHCECSYVNIGATHTWPLPYSRRCSYANIGATHMWPLPYSNMWVLICCYSYGILLWL